MVTYKEGWRSSPSLLTGLQHCEGKLLHANIICGPSCELQQLQAPKSRDNKGEKSQHHLVHSHAGCRAL